MEEKRCVLCNKPYNYKYHMFGRGCLDNIYELLEIRKSPRFILDKELYLCTRIAWRNHKFFLNRNKKYVLAQKYIAIQYLEKMNYNFLDDIMNKIKNDIKGISLFAKNIVETVSFSLNEIYKLYNYKQRFDELIKEFQEVDWEKLDKEMAESFIKRMSFIFDETKKSKPISYAVYYSMQYTFWQIVVAGGILANFKLSAKLLRNSLSLFGKQPDDLIIDDEKINEDIQKSEEFKDKIKQIIEKYCKDSDKFSGNSLENKDCKIEFNDNWDLHLAIHGSPINIYIEKSQNETWNINMEITDIYDFTDFKDFKEYATSNKSIVLSILATTLNNFAVVSSEYGVIKPYKVTIKVQEDNHVVEKSENLTIGD